MTVQEASRITGLSQQFIRYGLQQQRLPFGVAVKMSDDRWTYDVSEHLLKKYIGEEAFNRAVNK